MDIWIDIAIWIDIDRLIDIDRWIDMLLLLLLFATTRSVFTSVMVSVVEIAKRTN